MRERVRAQSERAARCAPLRFARYAPAIACAPAWRMSTRSAVGALHVDGAQLL